MLGSSRPASQDTSLLRCQAHDRSLPGEASRGVGVVVLSDSSSPGQALLDLDAGPLESAQDRAVAHVPCREAQCPPFPARTGHDCLVRVSCRPHAAPTMALLLSWLGWSWPLTSLVVVAVAVTVAADGRGAPSATVHSF